VRFAQGKGEYEITALDMVLDKPEHHDLTVFFRVVPSKFGDCSSACEKIPLLSVRIRTVNFYQIRKKEFREEDIAIFIL